MATIAIRTHDGHYVSAENGGGGRVAANGIRIGEYETFRVVECDDNRIALQTYDGHFLCAEKGGGGVVAANRNEIGAWETFQVIYRGVNDVALKTYSGHFLSAQHGGGTKVVADRREIGNCETFAPIYRANMKIQFDSSDFAKFPPATARESAWHSCLDNDSDSEIGHLLSKRVHQPAQFTLTLSETLAVGVSGKFLAEIPFIASSRKAVTGEMELVAGQAWSKVEGFDYQFSDVVTVPAHAQVEARGMIDTISNIPIPYVLRYWVSARDMDGNRLSNDTLLCFLHQQGFTGAVVDRSQSNKILVAISATIVGTWGTGTGIDARVTSHTRLAEPQAVCS